MPAVAKKKVAVPLGVPSSSPIHVCSLNPEAQGHRMDCSTHITSAFPGDQGGAKRISRPCTHAFV